MGESRMRERNTLLKDLLRAESKGRVRGVSLSFLGKASYALSLLDNRIFSTYIEYLYPNTYSNCSCCDITFQPHRLFTEEFRGEFTHTKPSFYYLKKSFLNSYL